MNTRADATATITAKPSDLALATEDELGAALAKLRQAMRKAKGKELEKLQDKRDALTKRLDQFVFLHLAKIDKDPEIKAVIVDLSQLTIDIQKTAREMEDAEKAIKKATKIIGYADQFLATVLKLKKFVA